MAEKLFNLISTDVGRPLIQMKPGFDCPELESLIRECIDKAVRQEREVQDRSGKWYTLHVRPYKNVDNRIVGAVLVLVDIDVLKRRRLEDAIVDTMVRVSDEALVVVSDDWIITHVSSKFGSLFHLDREALVGRSLFEVDGGRWNQGGLRETSDRLFNAGGADVSGHVVAFQTGTEPARVTINASRLHFHDGEGDRILIAVKPLPTNR